MSRSSIAASALLALALGACARQAGVVTIGYLGGRAGQPHGWPAHVVTASTPPQPVTVTSHRGGRAAQPGGWPELANTKAGPPMTAAYLGGRAAQPSGWPVALTPVPASHVAALNAQRGSSAQ